MTRSHILALVALAAAVPAAMIGANSLFSAEDAPCFSTGTIGYRLTDRSPADVTIRIDNAAAEPDLTLQLVDDPARADFVLADGAETAGVCAGLRAIRTIRIDPKASQPDFTIALRTDDADDAAARYRIYAHSPDFTAQDAAALFAVMVQGGRKSATKAAALRQRDAHDDDITGALTPRSPRGPRQ